MVDKQKLAEKIGNFIGHFVIVAFFVSMAFVGILGWGKFLNNFEQITKAANQYNIEHNIK